MLRRLPQNNMVNQKTLGFKMRPDLVSVGQLSEVIDMRP